MIVETGILPDYKRDNFELNETKRKAQLIKIFSWAALALMVSVMLFNLILFFFTSQKRLDTFISGIIFIGFCTLCIWLAEQQKIRLAGWLLILLGLAVNSTLYLGSGTVVPVAVGYVIYIGVAAIVLSLWETALVTALVMLLTFSFYLVIDFLKLYSPPLNNENNIATISGLLIFLFAMPVLALQFTLPNRQQTKALKEQNQKLFEALQALQQRQMAGLSFSEQVLSTSTDLNGIANKQVSGAQQQVSAITEFSTSLTELTQTASAIYNSAKQVAETIEAVLQRTTQALETSARATAATAQGRAAVSDTIATNQQVGLLYQTLVTILLNLSKRAENIRFILDLIDSIADETHLLALNAAIEAAGAGIQGERFGVVAQEVKHLADRARAAGSEVRQLVEQIESGVAQAVMSVESGSKVAAGAIAAAHHSDRVITHLSETVVQTEEQNNIVVSEAQQVLQLAEEIRLATQQQQSASEQLLKVLHEINLVAEENVKESFQIIGSAKQLETLSVDLKAVLA